MFISACYLVYKLADMVKCSNIWHADNHSFVYVIKSKVLFVSGHFGYIELPIPIYHPSHVSDLKKMLSLLCLKCLKLKTNKVWPDQVFPPTLLRILFMSCFCMQRRDFTKILVLLVLLIVPLCILRKDRGTPCFYFHFLLRNEVVYIRILAY